MPSEPTIDMEDKYAPKAWGQDTEFDFTCPSGQLCRLRKIDPIVLISEGLLDQLDFLTGIVNAEHIPAASKTAIDRAKEAKAKVGTANMTEAEKKAAERDKIFEDIMKDPSRMRNFTRILDKVVVRAVVAPEITAVPEIFNKREDGKIYADTIDFNDKMAIFNRVMKGVTDLEQFRSDTVESVESVARSTDVRKSTKRSPRAKR